MSWSNRLPKSFDEDELLATGLYEYRKLFELANSSDDTSGLRCVNCRGLLLTAYSPYCGHHFCGQCIRKIISFDQNVDWKCPEAECPCLLNRSRLERGETEESIKSTLQERTYIRCPWKCSSDILIKNIFEHQLTCYKAKKHVDDNMQAKMTKQQSNVGQNVTVEKLKKLQDMYEEKFRHLETEINSVKNTNDRFENDIRELKAKMERMKTFVSKYTSICTQVVGQRQNEYRNPEASAVILAEDVWEIDLSAAAVLGSDAPPSFFEGSSQIDSHRCQMHELALLFEVGLVFKSACGLQQTFLPFLSVLPSEVDDFHQWPLRATAILKLMDDDKAIAEREVHVVVDSVNALRGENPKLFYFQAWSQEDLGSCKSYLAANKVTMSILISKNKFESQAGSGV